MEVMPLAPPAPETTSGVRRVLYVTMFLNIIVAAAKIAYGYWADILSVRADGFHSVTDSLNNIIALVAVWIAAHPPDDEHPYGHRKFEVFAGWLIGLSLLVVAYDVISSAIERLGGKTAHLPEVTAATFAVLGGTLAVNLVVAGYEARKGKELDSPILLSDAHHTRSDCFVTAGVMLAAVFIKMGYQIMDVIAAGVVALFIAWAGVEVIRSNLKYLADTALVDKDKVRAIVLNVPGVASAHKVRSRGTPGAIYLDLHVQIAPHLNVIEAHKITHWAIDALKKGIPGVADVTVHTEPAHPHQRYEPLPDEDVEYRKPADQ